MCAALGKLPGQRTPTVIFAEPPSHLDTSGSRPLGKCGGWSPNGCGPHAYSNDDIFFLEACVYALVCANSEDLFRVRAGQPYRCRVSEGGFRRMQRYLTEPTT